MFSHFLSVAPSSSPSSSCRLIPFPFTCYKCSTIVVCRDVIFLTFNYSLNTVSRWLKKAHLYPIVLFAVMITMHIFPPHTERVGPFNIYIHLNSSWIRMKRKNSHEHILEWCFCSSSSSSHLVVDGKQIFFLFLSISLLPHSSHFSTASARRVCTEWTPKKKRKESAMMIFFFLCMFMNNSVLLLISAHPLCKLSEICWILSSADFFRVWWCDQVQCSDLRRCVEWV